MLSIDERVYQTTDGVIISRDEFIDLVENALEYAVEEKNFNYYKFFHDLKQKNDMDQDEFRNILADIREKNGIK